MAWTRSAPHGETVAAVAIIPARQLRALSAIVSASKPDTSRTLCLAFAAFLVALGTAIPHLNATEITTLLFACGAALVAFTVPLQPAVKPSASALSAMAVDRTNAIPVNGPTAILNELLASRSQAANTDRAAWARLTSHMSHELRTPLNAILGFSELMSAEVFGPLGSSLYAGYARDIHASGHSLLKSAEDALAITALLTAPEQRNRSDVTHLASAAGSALKFHARDFCNRSITASSTLDIDAEIIAQEQSVRQLMINLLSDAAERAMPGASITLASRQIDCQIEISVTVSGERPARGPATDSFPLLLARTLAELSSATLIESESQTAVRFTLAAQNDFFTSRQRYQ